MADLRIQNARARGAPNVEGQGAGVPGAGDANAVVAGGAPPRVRRREPEETEEKERLEKICVDAVGYFRDVSSQIQAIILQMQRLDGGIEGVQDVLGALQHAQGLADNISLGIPVARRECRAALGRAERVLNDPQIDDRQRRQILGLIDVLNDQLGDGNVNRPEIVVDPRNGPLPRRVDPALVPDGEPENPVNPLPLGQNDGRPDAINQDPVVINQDPVVNSEEEGEESATEGEDDAASDLENEKPVPNPGPGNPDLVPRNPDLVPRNPDGTT